MRFNLDFKDYARELYVSKFIFEGQELVAIVRMRYHTVLHYWHVEYYWKNVHTGIAVPEFRHETDIKTRKEARRIAVNSMNNASLNDWNSINDFYKKSILGKKT